MSIQGSCGPERKACDRHKQHALVAAINCHSMSMVFAVSSAAVLADSALGYCEAEGWRE